MSAARDASRRTFAALSIRNYRLYFIGQAISNSGTWMQSTAQGWLVLTKTHDSALMLGVTVALQQLPLLLFISYGGVIADRGDKQRILYVTQSASAVLALVLGLLVSTGADPIGAIFVLAFLLGMVNLFDNPARQAFIQEMVGRELIANAVSLNSALMNGGRLFGPLAAGAFITSLGIAACFYVNAASFATLIVALLLMQRSELLPIRTVPRERGQLMMGVRYVRSQRTLRDVLIATAIVGTFAFNFTVTLPIFSKTTFHQGGRHALPFTLMMAAMGLGAIFGGLYVAHRSRPTIRLLTVLAGLFGAFLTAVALSPTLWLAITLMVPSGAAGIAFVSTANALLQLNSIEEMRGRVMSLYAAALIGSTPVGALIVSLIIDGSNPRVGILTGSVLTLATGAWLFAALRRAAQAGPAVATA